MFRPLKFDVIYKENGVTVRKPVKRGDFDGGGITTAYVAPVVPEGEDASKVADVAVHVDWVNTFVVQSAGVMDKVGAMIFHGDLLKDEDGKLHEVVFYNAGMFVLMGDGDAMTGIALEDSVARKLERVGDVFLNADLIAGKAEDLNAALERGSEAQ